MAKKLKKITPSKPEELKEKPQYPTLYLSSKDLPEIKNWKVGKTYKLIIQVKQTSMREDIENRIDASFDIKKIATNDSYHKDQKLRSKIRDL